MAKRKRKPRGAAIPRKWSKADVAKIDELALDGCSLKDIAALSGLPESSIRRHYGDRIALRRAERRRGIRNAQTEKALKGDVTMLVWLGKNELEQTDKKKIEGNMGINFATIAKRAVQKKANDGSKNQTE